MISRRACTLALVGALLVPTLASAVEPVFRDDAGLAIRGADPVAYFTEGAHRPGSPSFTTEWMGATWRFTSAEHRDQFVAEPAKYAPQYGGYCAYAVSQGYTASVDPEAFTVVDGKLYLNYSKSVEKKWRAQREAFIAAANDNWPRIRDGK